MSKPGTHSPEFKARVAMESISVRKTIQEMPADYAIHPSQVIQWKRQLLDRDSDLFTRGIKSKDKQKVLAKKAELFQQYCCVVTLGLRQPPNAAGVAHTNSAALTPMNGD
jgi:transposase-like protein